MCSPLVCAAMKDRAKLNRSGIWLYNLGRILSYSGAGLILGAGGQWLGGFRPQWGIWLSKILGTIIIIIALTKAWEIVFKKSLWRLNTKGATAWLGNRMSTVAMLPPSIRDLMLGLITVFLPCMTLTPALAAAAGTGSSVKGLLYMAAFALGTVPVMLGATYVPLVIYRKIPEKMARWLVVIFLLLAGIITIIRH